MKIKYITNARIPTEKAHGYQICKMCEEFGKEANEVELIVPKRKNSIKDSASDYYGLQKNFRITYLWMPDFIKLDKLIGGRLACYLQELFFLARLMIKKIQNGAVIYTRSPEIAWLYKLKKFKTVYEMHYWPGKRKGLFFYLIKKCDMFIVLTKELKKILIAHGIREENILVSPDGVDPDIFDIAASREDARKIFSFPAGKIILGYSGQLKTMDREKGIETIFKALAGLDDNIIFCAAGGSAHEIEYYKELAGKMGINERVFFTGKLDRKKLAIFQKACDILLMPFPKNDHYNLYMSPLKMFEYMAAKRPIIASNLKSIKEVLRPDNAVLIEPDDAEDLARAIKVLVNSEIHRNKIAQNAYIDSQKYTWRKRTQKILDLIGK